ncbi:efflux RND transporter periplasmic adaptor subunit [soil metagenome]
MTPQRRNGLILFSGVVVAAVAGLSYRAGQYSSAAGQTQSVAPPAATGTALYWYDPMVPTQHFDHPGKSPFMEMQLVPKLADGGEGAADGAPSTGVRVDPRVMQNLGVRTAEVRRGRLDDSLVTTGVVQFNERDVSIVQPRSAGFVQQVYGRAPGDILQAGAPIADLLVPEWAGAQTEFLAVRRAGDAALTAAARQRLLLLGMSPSQIAAVERDCRAHATLTITSPTGGVVQKLDVRQGMTVAAGQTLAEVNGLSTVWVTAAVPEAQAGRVRVGQGVSVSFAAYPGETFPARVQTVLPQVAGDSRTLQVRLELTNRGGRLRPGLFAQVSFEGEAADALLVPTEALIRTGRRTLVMLARPQGRFEPVEVRTGREAGGGTEVLAGLNERDRVVASGQFLLDSESSLSGLNARPVSGASPPSPSAAPPMASALGRVESVAEGAVTISHEPVPSIGWPAMTMTFHVSDPALVRGVKTGDRVRFGFDQPPSGPTVRSLDKVVGG